MMIQKSGQINVSVANIYIDGTYHSEIVTQALLGEKIIIKETQGDFSQVSLPDDYRGWISNYQWVPFRQSDLATKKVRSHFARIFDMPNENAEPIKDVTIGMELLIIKEKDCWHQVLLPDGNEGWIASESFNTFPENTRQGLVELAGEFLGYPYFWGGRSVRGFDCSGLIQMIHSLVGIHLPRDAWMQQRDSKPVSEDPGEALPGDLYFFAEYGTKITHVGLATGDHKMIHARGYVRINSLNPKDEDYSEELFKTFADVRTFIK